MPNTWNIFKSIKNISAVIIAYAYYLSFTSRKFNLKRFQWMMIFPSLHKLLQRRTIGNANMSTDRKISEYSPIV